MEPSLGFIAKKVISGLLQPLPLLILISMFALLLLWFSKYQKFGKSVLSLTWLALLLISLQPVADKVLLPLESHYQTLDIDKTKETHPDIKYIVVLGGGHAYNPNWAPSSNVLNNSLPRIIEGIRIQRAFPNSQLIFTGGAALNKRTAAQSAEAIALSLGVAQADILRSDTPKDTAEEAIEVKAIIGDNPFILVTSANHLPRAVKAFENVGLVPIPAPANQLAITTELTFWEKWMPAALYLSHFERVWSEYMGQAWQKIQNG